MLVRPNSTPHFARSNAGGKGYNLYRMSAAGLPVPPWRVVGRHTFDQVVGASERAEPIAQQLEALKQGACTPAEASEKITAAIEGTTLPQAVVDLVAGGYAELGEGLISVRSSAADEDSSTHSFAGQLSSFLYVEGIEDVLTALKRCWASGYSARSLAYRLENSLSVDAIGVAVVLQTMVDPDTSGVMFTCDPTTGSADRFVVSAVYGVGEGLVSGALEGDTFWIDADNAKEADSTIGQKEHAFRRGDRGECRQVPVESVLHDKPALTPQQLRTLHALGKSCVELYGRAQDIEWAIAGETAYLLQARPVTTLKRSLLGYPNLWDNSNIIESYGGLTSPLSFTFALHNYHNVYVQFCEILNVPARVIRDMDPYLRNMLGCMNGRVFYNLYNWYKLVGVLPGFKHNREFMETMMGVSEALSDEIARRTRPHHSWDTWRGKWRKLRTGLAFLGYHIRIQPMVDRFLSEFHEHYDRYRTRPFRSMRSDQIYALYLELDALMLSTWKAPIINDFLCMVHFGMLKKLTAKWLPASDATLHNDLLAGEGEYESAEPTKELMRMAVAASENAELRKLLETTPAPDCLEALTQSPFNTFTQRVASYIDRFGFRCMNEMKLEETDLVEDPSYLFVCLKNYLRSGTIDLEAMEARERELRLCAERKLRTLLSGPKRWLYMWTLKHARKAVKNRENTRFARTRVYGLARAMFNAMADDLCSRGVLKRPDDLFFLTLDEIHGLHNGTLPSFDLDAMVTIRRESYATFADLEPKARFLTRGPVYWHNSYLVEAQQPVLDPNAEYDLKGLACCPGIVEGVVKVVRSAADDLELDGEILVTPRTDPGWVPLYPSISGLLVERGSSLSHSAIVAREMGLPAIVSIPGLMQTLKTGMRVRMDGALGTVTIVDRQDSQSDVLG